MSYAARDRRLERLGFESYRAYLASDLWKSIRRRVFWIKGSSCSLCPSTAVSVHHTSYSREVLLGNDIEPLWPICHPCHEAVELHRTGVKRDLRSAKSAFRRRLRARKIALTRSIRPIHSGPGGYAHGSKGEDRRRWPDQVPGDSAR